MGPVAPGSPGGPGGQSKQICALFLFIVFWFVMVCD